MKSVKHNGMIHENSPNRLPINKRLTLSSYLKGRHNNFEYGDLVLKQDHKLIGGCIEYRRRVVDVILMQYFKVGKAEQQNLLLFLSDDIVFVI